MFSLASLMQDHKEYFDIFFYLNIPQVFFYIIASKYNGNILQI